MDDKFYCTTYNPDMFVFCRQDKPRYASGFWSTKENVQSLIKQRGLNETLVDAVPNDSARYEPAHELLEKSLDNRKSRKAYNSALHAMTWLCFLADRSGESSYKLIGDGGILHEFIHEMSGACFDREPVRSIIRATLEIELAVPGYLSNKQKQIVSERKRELDEYLG